MRSATLAKLALTATVGIGALIGQATLASAGPGPQQGSVKFGPAPTTTMKPLEADPVDYCDLHLCLPADEVDPEPPKPCGPIDCLPAEEVEPQSQDECDGPSCTEIDDKDGPGCKWTHGCPQDDDECVPDAGRPPCPGEDPDPDCPLGVPPSECDDCEDGPVSAIRSHDHCEDPCDEDLPGDPAPRSNIEDCDDPCEQPPVIRHEDQPGGDDCGGTTDGGTDGTTDGGTDGTTDGGTDGGTDGHDGRLPKTGVEILSLVGLGAGGVGIGAVLKRLGRRSKDQDQE
jgi:hypothetical protein